MINSENPRDNLAIKRFGSSIFRVKIEPEEEIGGEREEKGVVVLFRKRGEGLNDRILEPHVIYYYSESKLCLRFF